MKQILLQYRSVTNPCPCGCTSIPMASMTAGWECQGGNHCLLLPAKLGFLLAKRSRIPVCCVLGVPGGIWDESLWTYLTSPCPGSSRDKPSSLWKNIERPPTKTSEAGRHSDMEGHHNPSQRHSPQGAIVLGMFLKLCNRRNVIWERKWENYLEAIPQ